MFVTGVFLMSISDLPPNFINFNDICFLLTGGKQRQESTVGNVTSEEGEKGRASKHLEKLYVPQTSLLLF